MKIKKFKLGDFVPPGSKYIEKERLCTKNEFYDCDCPAQLNCDCRDVEYTTFFYFEVPEGENK